MMIYLQRISQPQKTAFLGLKSAYLGCYEMASNQLDVFRPKIILEVHIFYENVRIFYFFRL
jgi:hypothetical protein